VVARGYLNMGDLRDALSRNQLKLDDLAGPREFLLGDRLLRLNGALARALDGVYHRGEVYLRWLQRFSSLAFGTPLGRSVTRYLALPYGGAFVLLSGLDHVVGHSLSKLGWDVRLATPWSIGLLGTRPSQEALEECDALLRRAFDLGVTFIDTGDTYGNGRAEEIIPRALGHVRDRMVIATKFGYDIYRHADAAGQQERPQRWDGEFVRFACEQSLRRLGTDHIDLYQLHNPRLPDVQRDELFATLEVLRDEGKIRYYGAALGPAIGGTKDGNAIMRARRLTALQVIYNALEQTP